MFAYRVGRPGWKLVARAGCSLKTKVAVMYDKEAQVYVATCEDFLPYLGIATEAETPEELKEKLSGLFAEALEEAFKKKETNTVIPSFDLVTLQ
ncbi:DUF1902 domain-containing protein [Turicimonas muris]|uniref:DUF1902 domain-containing protein n=1 Tax=Turicimonas muris TaxID=1796652 RepID=UPI00248BA832|nr:DUF1902 domain-containing protein [Turicimonas muris]MBS4768868.1 DUF1902 domain-containing protein [Burkholderiales bacterium]